MNENKQKLEKYIKAFNFVKSTRYKTSETLDLEEIMKYKKKKINAKENIEKLGHFIMFSFVTSLIFLFLIQLEGINPFLICAIAYSINIRQIIFANQFESNQKEGFLFPSCSYLIVFLLLLSSFKVFIFFTNNGFFIPAVNITSVLLLAIMIINLMSSIMKVVQMNCRIRDTNETIKTRILSLKKGLEFKKAMSYVTKSESSFKNDVIFKEFLLDYRPNKKEEYACNYLKNDLFYNRDSDQKKLLEYLKLKNQVNTITND